MPTTTASYVSALVLFLEQRIEADIREDVPRYHQDNCRSRDIVYPSGTDCDCDGPARHREILLAIANAAEGLTWLREAYPSTISLVLQQLASPWKNHHDYPKG